MSEDLFDDALTIEDDLYKRGYNQGYEDGERAGKIEGRSFGLAKGFEKFAESGRLYGRAVVWANRLPSAAATAGIGSEGKQQAPSKMPPLPDNARLTKNIESVHALMEPATLPTENSDDAVQDFDDRFKRRRERLGS
ncbi:unnamed protein product [Parascedosporium putredinis]|nr:unnamed protein product [Parascedosporium putredinis]CAI7996523.1 unnamed protein product [Parascedosporium putredinis]